MHVAGLSIVNSRRAQLLAGITSVAFLLRLAAGLAKGPDFIAHGYTFYADIARTFLDGDGLCVAAGVDCAVRMPVYPLVVAPFLAAGLEYPWLIILKALIGAMLPLIAYGLGKELFTPRIGLAAAAATALNPYAVVHGPSFQETVIFNVLIAGAMLALMHAVRRGGLRWHVTAGVLLALAMLTTVRMALFVPVALAWVIYASPAVARRDRVLRALAVALPVLVLVGSWAARNARLVGSPVLTTEAGLSLWLANNDVTMTRLPNRSIDGVEELAWLTVTHDHAQRARRLAHDPVAYDRFLGSMGVDYIVTNPGPTLVAALQKLAFSFGGWLSPARQWPIQLGYMLIFLPMNVLALIGLWRARSAGGAHLLVILLFLTFAITTAVFWAHTSHRSFLHAFKFIYAASVMAHVVRRVAVPTFARQPRRGRATGSTVWTLRHRGDNVGGCS